MDRTTPVVLLEWSFNEIFHISKFLKMIKFDNLTEFGLLRGVNDIGV